VFCYFLQGTMSPGLSLTPHTALTLASLSFLCSSALLRHHSFHGHDIHSRKTHSSVIHLHFSLFSDPRVELHQSLLIPMLPCTLLYLCWPNCWHFLTSLKLGCHPQHDTRNVVLNKCKCSSRNKYEICKRTDNTDVAF
jgi:hypothetical protein